LLSVEEDVLDGADGAGVAGFASPLAESPEPDEAAVDDDAAGVLLLLL